MFSRCRSEQPFDYDSLHLGIMTHVITVNDQDTYAGIVADISVLYTMLFSVN